MRNFQIPFFLLVLAPRLLLAKSSESPGRIFGETDATGAEPVRLTKPVIDALLAAKEAEPGRGWKRGNPGKDLNYLFKAFPVRLSKSSERDYVVWGQKILSGADNDWFWVVRSMAPRPRVVLFCGALSVELLPGAHKSLQDIRCSWESPGGDGFIRDYQFNGQRYLLSRETETHRTP